MTIGKYKWFAILTTTLIIIITVAGTIIWLKYPRSQQIKIITPDKSEIIGKVHIDGAVKNPGYYSLRPGDSLEDIISAAGNITSNADRNEIKLYVPYASTNHSAQKIDINRAEQWLLQAIPGIGETRAKAIIEYRNQNGFFLYTYELVKVDGIGNTTYENIKHLITVSDIY